MFAVAIARRKFTPEYKKEAVKLVVTSGRVVATGRHELPIVLVCDSALVLSPQLDPRNNIVIEESKICTGQFGQIDDGLRQPRPSSRIDHRV